MDITLNVRYLRTGIIFHLGHPDVPKKKRLLAYPVMLMHDTRLVHGTELMENLI